MNENFQFESQPQQPDTSLEVSSEPTEETNPETHRIIGKITKLLNYDVRTMKATQPAVTEFIYQTLTELPPHILDAIYDYMDRRELELWKEQSGSLNSGITMRISDEMRRQAHDKAARLLVDYNPELYPDLITARRFITDLTDGDSLVSRDIIDAKRDNEF